MTIETKYNIGDEVWFTSFKSPRRARVCGMSIYITKCGEISFVYGLNDKDVYWHKLEQDLFPTKEELLKVYKYENG